MATISRGAYNVVKGLNSGAGMEELAKASRAEEKRRAREAEEELMGGTRSTRKEGKGSTSDIKERNLSQMVAVLHNRIGSLEKLAHVRLELCAEDLMPNSTRTSKLGPKLTDDLDGLLNDTSSNQRPGMREGGGGSQRAHKDNLVSTEGVFIDPVNLVLRTKPPSETAKKLELALEDIFGNSNATRFKGKKKPGALGLGAKQSSLQKFEAKKAMRMRLEKQLITNMESFQTRSVLEPEVTFVAPLSYDEPTWPISVKYSPLDPMSRHPDNSDGEMDLDLIMRYALQRISLPSGEKMFNWLVRQPVLQQYFLYLFWMIKVKFFQQEGGSGAGEAAGTVGGAGGEKGGGGGGSSAPSHDAFTESYLLHHMSSRYAMVMELLHGRTNIEHEKDFVYRFLPYILCNAMFFGFTFVCPGSRHLYTKGFRKTLLMQVVQLMHGIQMCPISVKVSWAKLFPDDAHDDEEVAAAAAAVDVADGEAGGGAENIPVPSALAASQNMKAAKEATARARAQREAGGTFGGGGWGESSTSGAAGAATDGVGSGVMEAAPPRGGILADGSMTLGMVTGHGAGQRARTESAGSKSGGLHAGAAEAGGGGGVGGGGGGRGNNNQGGASTGGMGFGLDSRPSSRPQSAASTASNAGAASTISEGVDPLLRTFLTAPPRRPNKFFTSLRQNTETLDAKNVSPLMQEFLGSKHSSTGFRQVLSRTVPISWCPAGGVDTHKKRTVSIDFHDTFSTKLDQCEYDYARLGVLGHRRQIAAKKMVERTCLNILSGGQTRISQAVLDLIKRQRAGKDKDKGKEAVAGRDDEEMAPSGVDLFADGDLDAFLEDFD